MFLLSALTLFYTNLLFDTSKIFAHCDTLDGPVVKAARNALETGNINYVLIWVQKSDEEEIKKAFQKTLAVRKLNPEAKELADMYFFETLVRVHRAGEGEPYTGIKPAGYKVEPGIEIADKSIEKGSIESVLKFLNDRMQENVLEHFNHVQSKKKFKTDDVEAGREYVKAYVEFIHSVENIFESTRASAHTSHTSQKEAEKDEMHSETNKEEHSETRGGEDMEFKSPKPLKVEQEELH